MFKGKVLMSEIEEAATYKDSPPLKIKAQLGALRFSDRGSSQGQVSNHLHTPVIGV